LCSKVAASPKVAAAKKLAEETQAKLKATAEAEIAKNPGVLAAQKDVAAADDAAFDAESQRRIVEYIISELHRNHRAVEFKKCTFSEQVDLSGCRFHGRVDMRGVTALDGALDFGRAEVVGALLTEADSS
jgi:hypothetical protein